MDAQQIKRFMRDSNTFKGVYAKDELPSVPSVPCSYIVNTDVSMQPGKHWIAIYITANTIYYFDSYGGDPFTDFYLTRFIKHVSKPYMIFQRAHTRIQSVISSVCGYYAMGFILYMECDGGSVHAFIRMFPNKRCTNDAYARAVAHQYRAALRNKYSF